MTVSSHFISFFVCNFLLGSGLIIRWIVCDTWLITIADDKERGRVIGVHETLMGVGIAIGPLLIAFFGFGHVMFYISVFLIFISGLFRYLLSNLTHTRKFQTSQKAKIYFV